ncbi:YceD family protein [Saliterribacillus persicus]|uniref:DUF177 domain-containing protein n=1 Tax=Saliterribacillus persicus TaxID=930114 RepID=A0A368XSG5_9BACI|nr:YceD family protein [Saliterribacillus persicus]RCW70815.1 uncharacterized protein DFR57_106215 [Saliterribacillus persicus]
MKFYLQKIRQSGSEPFIFDEKIDISDIKDLPNDIRHIDPVHVKGQGRMERDEIVFQFQIVGSMILPCARTLVDVPFPFSIDVEERFTTKSYVEEDEDSDIHPVLGEVIDLTPYIKEHVILVMPMRVFADDKVVQDHMLKQGEGWEVISEEKSNDKIDPRLKKLEALLDDNQED